MEPQTFQNRAQTLLENLKNRAQTFLGNRKAINLIPSLHFLEHVAIGTQLGAMLATFSFKMGGPNQIHRFSVFQESLGSIFKVFQKGLGSILEGLGLDFRGFPRRFGLDV